MEDLWGDQRLMVTTPELDRRGLRYGVIVDAAVPLADLQELDRRGLRYKVEVADGLAAADRATLDARGLRYFVPVAVGVAEADKASLDRQGLRYAVQVDADILQADRDALERQGLRYFVEVDSSGNSVAPGAGVVGGAALLADETNGFATDFTYATDASRVAVKTAGTVVASGLDAFYSNAGTSPKQVFDISGNLVWSPHNLLLRSEDFTNASWVKTGTPIVTAHTIQDDDAASQERADQVVTCVVGQNYTVSLWVLKDAVTTRFPAFQVTGTGNIILSLNTSTGATGVVASTYASVSHLVEDLGTHWKTKITFVAENTTTSLRIYPAYGITLGGVANNAAVGVITIDKVQWNRGAVPTEYLATTTVARYGLAIDYDPVTHAAKGLLCEPTATNLLLNSTTLSTQSVTVTAVAHTLSFLGTGTVTLTGVSTAGPLVGTGASNRVSLTFTPTAGSLTLTVAGSVNRAQLETGAVATSFVPTFGATATRTVNIYNITPASINYNATAGSWWIEVDAIQTLTGGRVIAYSGVVSPLYINSATTATLTDTVTLTKTVPSTLGQHKYASAYQVSDRAITQDGLAVATDTGATTTLLSPGASISFGSQTTGGIPIHGYIRKLYYLPRRMPNAEMVTETT